MNEEACDEGGGYGENCKLVNGLDAKLDAQCLTCMDWDADDALFNSYFLVKRFVCLFTK